MGWLEEERETIIVNITTRCERKTMWRHINCGFLGKIAEMKQ
jgi:hypothetical protein